MKGLRAVAVALAVASGSVGWAAEPPGSADRRGGERLDLLSSWSSPEGEPDLVRTWSHPDEGAKLVFTWSQPDPRTPLLFAFASPAEGSDLALTWSRPDESRELLFTWSQPPAQAEGEGSASGEPDVR